MASNGHHLTNIGQFYKQIDDFKRKLIHLLHQFGKNQEIIDINKYCDKILLLKQANARAPIELLYEYGVKKYCVEILVRDESFFLEQVSDLENRADLVEQRDVLFITQVRSVWNQITPQVKKNLWDYVQIICQLTEQITGGTILSETRQVLKKQGRIE